MTATNKALHSKAHPHKTDDSWKNNLIYQVDKTWQSIANHNISSTLLSRKSYLILEDAITWTANFPDNSVHAIVTDPPYGVIEYEHKEYPPQNRWTEGDSEAKVW